MDKVLVFTYYWPPSGGPAVQRWLALSQLLPQFGIEPIIVAPHEKYASYVLLDESLNQRIPKELKVVKTKTFEVLNFYQKSLGKGKLPTAGFANESNPSFLQKLARWVRGNLFFPDPRKGWNKFALKAAKQLIAENDIKAVITAGPPQSTHLIGQQLKKEYDLFWLCDFHDAWTNVWYYDELMKTSFARNLDSKMELKVLKECDHIITVGRQIISDFESKLGTQEKIHLHSMGFDDEMVAHEAKVNPNEFVICYTGTMASNYEPQVIFDSIKQILEQNENARIKVELYGLIADDIIEYAKSIGLEKQVDFKGYVPHKQAVEAIQNGAMLLLVSPNTPQAKMIIPGKIYEYLATRKPILNLAETGTETHEIIEECQAGATFNRNAKTEIKAFIEQMFNEWEKEPNSILNTDSLFLKYSRKTEAETLAKVLQRKF
jgi:glycosyltransferase involved in cell wall biosynthesis